MDCGAACLRMVAKYYGKNYSLADLRQITHTNREGASLLGLSDAAEKLGFRTLGVKITYNKLVEDVALPCIAHWNQNHFVEHYFWGIQLKYNIHPFPIFFYHCLCKSKHDKKGTYCLLAENSK